ncbi:MAG: hypothetical protein HXY30_07680 [Pseudorhodoplanes sp.]|nr:hypothetical protein [Pseudorhodoplanes sp.]
MRKRRNAQPAPDRERARAEGPNSAGAGPVPAAMGEAETREALLRRFTAVLDRWRECPARVCRRARRCAGPDFACIRLPPRRPRKPENDAAAMAHVQKILKRRLAETGQAYAPPKLRKSSPAGGR